MDIFERLEEEFVFPFPPYEYQRRAIKEAAKFDSVLLPLRVGAGKTPLATWLGLHHSLVNDVERLLFIVPASLVVQWGRWLEKIKFVDGGKLDILTYLGSPKQRAVMSFKHDCIIMSHQIFVKDYTSRISSEMLRDPNIFVTYDESQDGLRKAGNKIWRFFRNFTLNKRVVLLSGTPVSSPMDTYAVVKLLSPEIYPTKRAFENTHVVSRDFFGNVEDWKNLDFMNQSLYNKAVVIKDEELEELPGLVVDRVPYKLKSGHMKAYNKLVKEEFLLDDEGQIIDATEAQRMFHTLQRFVTSPDKLNLKSIQTSLLNILWTIYNEDDSKLIIYSNYRDTNRTVLEMFEKKGVKVVGKWGDFTRLQQQANLDSFLDDKEVRVMAGNPRSLGVGTDGLQHVCYRVVFTELPLTPPQFEQATGRIDRTGQQELCVAKCCIAEDTIQEQLYYALLNKDDLLRKVVEKKMDLKKLFS